jgi:DNA-3-methyladenine glycosylase II
MGLTIALPEEFSYPLALSFLERSPREVLHRVEDGKIFKLLNIEGVPVLFSIQGKDNHLQIEVLHGDPSKAGKEVMVQYVREWFDLETDLKPFYSLAKSDALLKGLVKEYRGYRIVGQPDLFESLVWAVLGQQINLAFAYTLKQRFVETFGERMEVNRQSYYIFPSASRVAQLSPDSLLALQFSRQKAAYTIGIARAFAEGNMSKEKLRGLPLKEAKEELISIKGIGNWTANYALMKTFRYPDAFPLEDAGLHNAIRNQLGLKSKPSLERVKKIFKKYKGWEAYATLYLWKSL